MNRPDTQAELLLSFQQERTAQRLAEARTRQATNHNGQLGRRLLASSGALLIMLGSRLQHSAQQRAGNPPAAGLLKEAR